jgi:hypothetical protein
MSAHANAILGKGVAPAPVLVVDSREQVPLPFSQLKTQSGTLTTGDYSILGAEELFAVERKTLADLVACCAGGRERFKRELHRLRGFRFKRLVVVGSEEDILRGNFRSGISPKAVLATLQCFEVRYDLPFLFFLTPELAARRIETWAIWFARELRKTASLLLEDSQVAQGRVEKTLREMEQPAPKRPAALGTFAGVVTPNHLQDKLRWNFYIVTGHAASRIPLTNILRIISNGSKTGGAMLAQGTRLLPRFRLPGAITGLIAKPAIQTPAA